LELKSERQITNYEMTFQKKHDGRLKQEE
jgi:hypothetical protein